MAGKKRKLKKDLKQKLRKELKRKLRKDIKKKDNKDKKVDKSRTEKQVIDNQTLQQIMMSQMMSSRDRVRKGDDPSWLATQNQAIADKIKQTQEINTLKEENRELDRQVKNIKETEQYKELEEELKQQIESNKKAVEQALKLIPLQEQVRELEAKNAELEQKINDPLNQILLKKTSLENYIKHLKETSDANDPAYKEMSDKIAEAKVLIKKYEDQEQLIESRNQLNTELENKKSRLKAEYKQLRKIYPKEFSGVKWNDENIDNILKDIIDKIIKEMAKKETTLKKYEEQKLIGEEYTKVVKNFKRTQAEMNADMEHIRQQVPDVLTGVSWKSKDRDEKILEAKYKVAIDLDNMNKQLEILKETSEDLKIINQVKATSDMYEENMRKEHPIFDLIYEDKLRQYGENITPEVKENVFKEALTEYKMMYRDNNNDASKTNEDDNPDYISTDDSSEDANSTYTNVGDESSGTE